MPAARRLTRRSFALRRAAVLVQAAGDGIRDVRSAGLIHLRLELPLVLGSPHPGLTVFAQTHKSPVAELRGELLVLALAGGDGLPGTEQSGGPLRVPMIEPPPCGELVAEVLVPAGHDDQMIPDGAHPAGT